MSIITSNIPDPDHQVKKTKSQLTPVSSELQRESGMKYNGTIMPIGVKNEL